MGKLLKFSSMSPVTLFRSIRISTPSIIISIDAGVIVSGFNSDHAKTFPVGNCSKKDLDLIYDTSKSLDLAIDKCIQDCSVGDIGNAVESYVLDKGYGLVRNYTGHGIGKSLHEPPQVPNFGKSRFRWNKIMR